MEKGFKQAQAKSDLSGVGRMNSAVESIVINPHDRQMSSRVMRSCMHRNPSVARRTSSGTSIGASPSPSRGSPCSPSSSSGSSPVAMESAGSSSVSVYCFTLLISSVRGVGEKLNEIDGVISSMPCCSSGVMSAGRLLFRFWVGNNVTTFADSPPDLANIVTNRLK